MKLLYGGSIMKKYLSILCALFIVASTASCSAIVIEDESKKAIVPASSDTDATTKEESESVADETEEKQENTEAPTETEKNAFSIDEQVLWETNDVTLTATTIDEDDFWGTGLKVLAENNSDKDVSIICDALIVNDFMISDLSCINVTAGNKSNETIYLFDSELEAAGIDKIGKIELYFHMTNSESYDRIAESECITIKTSLYDEIDTEADTSGTVLLEQDGVKIIGKYVDENSFWGAAALLYIENNSNKNVIVQVEDVAINGFMITSLCSQDVYVGKKAFTDIDFLSASLEENNIESIDTVEMKFIVLDENFHRIIETEKISFDAK